MLTPDELKAVPDNIVKIYQTLEEEIIADIARRLEKTGEITDTANLQLDSLTRLGNDLEGIKKRITDTNKLSREELDRLFREAAERSMEYENIGYKKAGKSTLSLEDSPMMQQFVKANMLKTHSELKNLTKSLGFKVGGQFLTVAKTYQSVLDYAQFQIASGAFSYRQAIQIAVRKLADSGLRTVDYESGRSNALDVAVRRATLTGINQTTAQLSIMQMGELGGEYVEVSAHMGARPDHSVWQGKVYHVGGEKNGYPDFESSTGYGTGAGLCGWNCRHSFSVFFPGSSVRNYSDRTLQNLDPMPFEYEGKTYTYYEATQKQRQIERQMRKTKREMVAYDAAGAKDDFTTASIKLRMQKDQYVAFSRAAGLKTRNERHQVYGFGRSVSTKGVWEIRKEKDRKKVRENFTFTSRQIGKKMGKHVSDFGMDPSIKEHRDKFIEVTRDTVYNYDKRITLPGWRGQKGTVIAFIKGDTVVITSMSFDYITTMKGGVDNKRVKNARERKI